MEELKTMEDFATTWTKDVILSCFMSFREVVFTRTKCLFLNYAESRIKARLNLQTKERAKRRMVPAMMKRS